jgi:hypothetical protein
MHQAASSAKPPPARTARSSVSPRDTLIFATYAGQPDVTDDDRVLAAALERRRLTVQAGRWDDSTVRWGDASAVVVRSTWDYFQRRDEFLAWTTDVAARTALYNTAPVIRWNSHKRYLATLASRGVPVIDTVFVDAGSAVHLEALAAEHRWEDIVVKPAVSAAAYETRHVSLEQRTAGQAHLDRLLAACDVMLQPHLAHLAERGELSLMFVVGRFTHAVRRRSALVDSATMPTSAASAASALAIRLAERVLAVAMDTLGVSEPPLYARVDLAEDAGGTLQLLELELIEPSMFFRHAPEAAEQMADAIASRLPMTGRS